MAAVVSPRVAPRVGSLVRRAVVAAAMLVLVCALAPARVEAQTSVPALDPELIEPGARAPEPGEPDATLGTALFGSGVASLVAGFGSGVAALVLFGIDLALPSPAPPPCAPCPGNPTGDDAIHALAITAGVLLLAGVGLTLGGMTLRDAAARQRAAVTLAPTGLSVAF